MFDRGQQESPEASAIAIGQPKILFLENSSEEFLCQVLRVMWTVPTPADVGIERIPVRAAQNLKGDSSLRTVDFAGLQHDTPVGGQKSPALTTMRITFSP